jgi:anaerobic C4-dicarboxylate transporter
MDFFHAFYRLFTVVAYSQPIGIAAFDEDGRVRVGAIVFTYSYVGIVVIILLQVATRNLDSGLAAYTC